MSSRSLREEINRKKGEIGSELRKYRTLNEKLNDSNYESLLKAEFNNSDKQGTLKQILRNVEFTEKKFNVPVSGIDTFLIYAKRYFGSLSPRKSSSSKRSVSRGGKWSAKYKKSIDCKRPKGFSQKQHCKYGRKTRKQR